MDEAERSTAGSEEYEEMISQGELRNLIEYDEETGLWRWRNPTGNNLEGWFAGAPTTNGYRQIRINGKAEYCHTLAWYWVYGDWVLELDHENRVKNDNRINNLRMSSKSTNAINSKLRIDNSTGHVGVFYNVNRRKKWYAYINKNGVKQSKSFNTFEEAVAWRKKIQEELFSQFVPKVVSQD